MQEYSAFQYEIYLVCKKHSQSTIMYYYNYI